MVMHTFSTRSQYLLALCILAISVFISGVIVVSAQEPDIQFPIVELGGCTDREDCEEYCNDDANIDACIAFAEANGLLEEEDRERFEKFKEIGQTGPGGCTTMRECEAYCDSLQNVNECLAFAEEHGFLDDEDLEDARMVQQALQNGASLPGGCTDKDSCEVYCEDPSNMNECLDFAVAAGFLSEEERADAEVAMQLIREGRSPGGCTDERSCEEYCDNEAHVDECLAFAEEAGFITPEEAEMARKTGGKGPGGCRGERECRAFCENPDNEVACMAFAREHGFMDEEFEEHEAEFKEQFKEDIPEEVRECVGDDFFEDDGFDPREMEERMRACFDELHGDFEDFPSHDGGYDGDLDPRDFDHEAFEDNARYFDDEFDSERMRKKFDSGEFDPDEYRDYYEGQSGVDVYEQRDVYEGRFEEYRNYEKDFRSDVPTDEFDKYQKDSEYMEYEYHDQAPDTYREHDPNTYDDYQRYDEKTDDERSFEEYQSTQDYNEDRSFPGGPQSYIGFFGRQVGAVLSGLLLR